MTEPIEAFCWVPVGLRLPTIPKDNGGRSESLLLWTIDGEWYEGWFCSSRYWRIQKLPGGYWPVGLYITHWAHVPAPKERK
jgi:hypothetical protein